MDHLLKNLCHIHSPSGEEAGMIQFILDYAISVSGSWKVKPQLFYGHNFQDCLIMIFGKPQLAAFAHMDTTGFTVRYQNQLIPIGSPEVSGGEKLVGKDGLGEIECLLEQNMEGQVHYRFGRGIEAGTSLSFEPNFIEQQEIIQSPYLDNRIGIYNLLKIAPQIEHGALVFSCWEEHGGGSVPYLVRFLYEKYQISQALISDVTWVTDGVYAGEGTVISIRDHNIPRRSFLNKITRIANAKNVTYQKEVEAHGSSDGREIQHSPYPVDWCFIGPPVQHVHSDHEEVHKTDISSMIDLYKILFTELQKD